MFHSSLSDYYYFFFIVSTGEPMTDQTIENKLVKVT